MTLILVHGALADKSQLAPLQSLLADRHTIHLVELEGHGETQSSAPSYSIEGFAANLASFIEENNVARPVIFGYSMGGYAALKLAHDSPQLVASVITLGTKLAWTPETAAREVSRLDPAKMRAKIPKFADELERRHRAIDGGWERVLANTARLMTELGANPIVGSALLRQIAQPVRLMVGDQDSLVSIEETREACKELHNGELAVLPSTPHPFEQVRASLVASMIDDFISRRSATSNR